MRLQGQSWELTTLLDSWRMHNWMYIQQYVCECAMMVMLDRRTGGDQEQTVWTKPSQTPEVTHIQKD